MSERNNCWLKKLDYFLGCPLIYCLGKMRKKRNIRSSVINNVLVMKTAAIGDTILVSAIVDEVKKSYPNCQVDILCSKNNRAVAKLLPGISKVYEFDMKNPIVSLIKISRIDSYDLLMDFAPWARINALISYIINAKFKVGFKCDKMYRHYIYDAVVEHSDKMHEIENYRNILRAVNIKPIGLLPVIRVKKNRILDKGYVVFHLNPGGTLKKLKQWKLNKWYDLAVYVYKKYHYKIFISGGIEDKKETGMLADKLISAGVLSKSIAAEYSLDEMADILANAKIVVTVDTGIMHLSAAVGAKLVVLQGPTLKERWGPLDGDAIVVSSMEKCRPCISLGFESKCVTPKCMEHISVDMVASALNKKLADALD